MSDLQDLLDDLAEADAVASALRGIAEGAPRDPVAGVNLDAVLRRRKDIERDLGGLLSARQLDLVRYRVALSDGSQPPAAAIARAVLLFQTLVTAIFDAIRTAPKRQYQPSPENQRMSALSFARTPAGSAAIHFTIPNERLLILESDLDLTFATLFELLLARSKTLHRNIAQRAGIASVAAAYALADNAVQHGLTTTISWGKGDTEPRTLVFPRNDALLFKTAVEALSDDSVEQIETDCELIALDEPAGTFRVATGAGETVAGVIADGFPRGGNWTTRRWYTGVLLRATRVRYATGEELVRWSLRGLVPQG